MYFQDCAMYKRESSFFNTYPTKLINLWNRSGSLDKAAGAARRSACRLLCLLAWPLLLGGCASIVTPSTDMPQGAAQMRSYHDSIDISGRLSVRYQQNGRDAALHGSFTWTQIPGQTILTLLSPLGQTLAVIEVRPDGALLTQAGQAPRSAADVDTLTAEALGWPLPVSGLRHWLQGYSGNHEQGPLAGSAATEAILAADGWRIRYPAWQTGESPENDRHPKRIDLERSTVQAGEIAIRIVLDNWQPH